jgi:NADH dehydrogenase
MRVFIAGGTGFVGGHVARELLRHGHCVSMLVHKHSPDIRDVDQHEGDVIKLKSFETAATGCDAFINLVGIIREYPSRSITFEKLHIKATSNALEAARKSGVARFIQMSALGTRPDAVSQYHRTKFQAEELVRKSGLEWTILRPSLVFGPKDAFINMLAGQLRLAPLMPIIGNGSYRLQPIHADDVARCFAMSLEMPETVGQCYGLCGNERMTYVELVDSVASAMGKPLPFKLHVPLGLMKLIIPIMQNLPLFPITMDQLQMLIEENVCDGSWKQIFRFEPRSFRGGIDEYLAPGSKDT